MSTYVTYGKALLPAIPGASKLPFVAGGGTEVPDLEVTRSFEIDGDHLAAYSKLVGARLSGVLPPVYPNLLAFPLHMQVITDRRFPFPAIGLVHVVNRIEQHRPIAATETLDLKVTPTKLQPHPKGRTFSLITEATSGGEVVWSGESTMLRRGKGDESARVEREDDPVLEPHATWKLPADLGRRYAGVSGDINPIHLYDVTAKAFGFKRAIIHGLWTKARALSALEGRLPGAFAVDVRFRKPILLPATVSFGSETDGDRTAFAVNDARKGTPHLAGTITSNERSAR